MVIYSCCFNINRSALAGKVPGVIKGKSILSTNLSDFSGLNLNGEKFNETENATKAKSP